MTNFVPWSSQPMQPMADQYARGQFIELDGRRTHYIESGEGEPLILLHGFFYDSYLWHHNIDALSKHFKVYALDLWGCGYSTREMQDFGYPLYAEQLRLFMDAKGIDAAALMGQSMGGGTAMKFCLQHPERVTAMVLVDAAGLPNKIPFSAKILNLPKVGEFLLGLETDSFRRDALTEFFISDAAKVTDEYYENAIRHHKIEGSLPVYMTIQRKQFFDKLADEIPQVGKLNKPTLIVWGGNDKAISRQHGERLHAALPGSEFVVYETAGHVPNYEEAEQFNTLSVKFLQKIHSEACTV